MEDVSSRGGALQSAATVRPRCPACGQVVSSDVMACPWCDRSLTYSVQLTAAVTAGRSACDELSRELEVIGGANRDVLLRRLGDAPGLLVSGVTRSAAQRYLDGLALRGVAARVVPTRAGVRPRPARESAPRRSSLLLFAAAGLLLLALALGLTHWSGTHRVAHRAGGGVRAPLAAALPEARALIEGRMATGATVRRAGGFYVSDRLLVTTSQVAGAEVEELGVNGRARAHLKARDEWLDVALIEVDSKDGSDSPLPLGDATLLHLGDRVQIPGTRVTAATVSDPTVIWLGLAFIRLDADLGEADAGSPVLDAAGRVIGIVSSRVSGSGRRDLVLPVNYLGMSDDLLVPNPRELGGEDWRRRLEAAGLADSLQAPDLLRELERPMLLQAVIATDVKVIATVGKLSPSVPQSVELGFHLLRDGNPICTREGVTSIFQPVVVDGSGVRMPPEAGWLARRGVTLSLYTADATLALDGCDAKRVRGTTLVVDQGLPNEDSRTVDYPNVGRPDLAARRH